MRALSIRQPFAVVIQLRGDKRLSNTAASLPPSENSSTSTQAGCYDDADEENCLAECGITDIASNDLPR